MNIVVDNCAGDKITSKLHVLAIIFLFNSLYHLIRTYLLPISFASDFRLRHVKYCIQLVFTVYEKRLLQLYFSCRSQCALVALAAARILQVSLVFRYSSLQLLYLYFVLFLVLYVYLILICFCKSLVK